MEHQIVCNQHCLIKRLELFIIADLTNIDKQNATQGERCRNMIRQLLSRAGALRKTKNYILGLDHSFCHAISNHRPTILNGKAR